MGLDGQLTGLTYRYGRSCFGAAQPLMDLLAAMARSTGRAASSDRLGLDHGRQALVKQYNLPVQSILIMGPPGRGKTTITRDCAYVLATTLGWVLDVAVAQCAPRRGCAGGRGLAVLSVSPTMASSL